MWVSIFIVGGGGRCLEAEGVCGDFLGCWKGCVGWLVVVVMVVVGKWWFGLGEVRFLVWLWLL